MLLIAVFAVGRADARHLPDRRAALDRRRAGVVWRGSLDTAWHLVLPVLTLIFVYLAEYAWSCGAR